MANKTLLDEMIAVGDRYMNLQANAAGIPRFKAELTDRLAQLNLPRDVIDQILQPVATLASEPSTSSTTFPYLSRGVVERVIEYIEAQK